MLWKQIYYFVTKFITFLWLTYFCRNFCNFCRAVLHSCNVYFRVLCNKTSFIAQNRFKTVLCISEIVSPYLSTSTSFVTVLFIFATRWSLRQGTITLAIAPLDMISVIICMILWHLKCHHFHHRHRHHSFSCTSGKWFAYICIIFNNIMTINQYSNNTVLLSSRSSNWLSSSKW